MRSVFHCTVSYFQKYYDILNFNQSPSVYDKSMLSRDNEQNIYSNYVAVLVILGGRYFSFEFSLPLMLI